MCLRNVDGEDFYSGTDKNVVDPSDGIAAEPGGERTMLVQDMLRVAEVVIDCAPGPGFRQAIEISAKDGRRRAIGVPKPLGAHQRPRLMPAFRNIKTQVRVDDLQDHVVGRYRNPEGPTGLQLEFRFQGRQGCRAD